MSVKTHMLLTIAAVAGAFSLFTASASAAAPAAGWSISSVSEPTNFQSSDAGHDRYSLTVVNVGSRATNDEVTIRDTLPPGLAVTRTQLQEGGREEREGTCVVATPLVTCTFEHPVPAGHELLLTILVEVESPLMKSEVSNQVTVSDAEGGEASASEPTMVNTGPAPFGINQFSFEVTGRDGRADTQSADHPFAVTSRIDLNTDLRNNPLGGFGGHDGQVVQAARSVVVELPLGFAGNPLAAERCPAIDMTVVEGSLGGKDLRTICPVGSIVGAVRLVWQGIARRPRL
jgi:hypothetical protein